MVQNVSVLPYKINSVIIINNNVGIGGAGYGCDYSVDVSSYKLDGVLNGFKPLCVLGVNPLIPIDDVSYNNGFISVDGTYNPYNKFNNIDITSIRGVEYSPTSDGVYNIRVGDSDLNYMYFDITIISNILQCYQKYFDMLLKHVECENICDKCNTPKSILKNYIEFNNLWHTIQNYSEYFYTFQPSSSMNTISPNNVQSLYNIINLADKYCVFCNHCKDCI